MSIAIRDTEPPVWKPLNASYNDPAANFAAIRGKWTVPAPKSRRLEPLQLPKLPVPPPPKEFVLPPVGPKTMSWQWLADQLGISTTYAHNIFARREKAHRLAWALFALIAAFGRPPQRKYGRREDTGLCKQCDQPRITAKHCAEHAAEASRKTMERYYRKKGYERGHAPKKPSAGRKPPRKHPHPVTGNLVSRQRVHQVKKEMAQ